MSYTEMFKVPEKGPVQSVAEFGNAFRSAWHVWSEMAQMYLHRNTAEMLSGGMQEVWDLCKNEDIPLGYRITMRATFDMVMVRRENFARLAVAMENFAAMFGPGSLLEQAKALLSLVDDETIYAVCWNQTSVAADAWWICEGEEGRPYDIARDGDHWFLFERLRR